MRQRLFAPEGLQQGSLVLQTQLLLPRGRSGGVRWQPRVFMAAAIWRFIWSEALKRISLTRSLRMYPPENHSHLQQSADCGHNFL